jgi:3-isopropylmalate/(R)-2-methylmalate dehydratase small subunit
MRNSPEPVAVTIDLATLSVTSPKNRFEFLMSERQRTMLVEGLDMIGASLGYRAEIDAFAQRHWAAQPWMKNVAEVTKTRLDGR